MDESLERRKQVNEISFKSEDHKLRFLEAMQAIGRIYGGKIDPEYGAAYFVVTADLDTWERAQNHIGRRGGLRFEEMFKERWSGGYMVLLQWAANLFNGQLADCNPVELMRLDEGNFEVALNALKLRRYGLSVEAIGERKEG